MNKLEDYMAPSTDLNKHGFFYGALIGVQVTPCFPAKLQRSLLSICLVQACLFFNSPTYSSVTLMFAPLSSICF